MAARSATPEQFFAGSSAGLEIFRAVRGAVDELGDVEVRVSKSQIAFRNRRGFAYVWRPAPYLNSDVPAVLSIGLPERVESERFKEIVRPTRKTWMHHIEMWEPEDVDDDVHGWLRDAYRFAN